VRGVREIRKGPRRAPLYFSWEVGVAVVRMRVDNKGRETAHGVCLSATEIEFRTNVGVTVFADEVLEFLLALSDCRVIFDLPPGAHRFIDVFLLRILVKSHSALDLRKHLIDFHS
jgi:hypothetical protein